MGWDELHRVAVEQIAAFHTASDEQLELKRHYLDFLGSHGDGHRKAGPGQHLTSSCLVLTPDANQVALTLHKKANQWYQFGGHLEASDTDLMAAALREGSEESGLDRLQLVGGILELDRHDLVGDFGHCRTHLDVRFLAVCEDEGLHTSSESLDVAWFGVDELPNPELAGLVTRGVQRLREI